MDSGNNRVHKFDAQGTFLTLWGSAGTGDGQFNCTEGLRQGNFGSAICMLAVDRDGNVFVTDRGNSRVEKFDGAGQLLTTWGRLGTGEGEFNHPFGITVDGQGNVYVGDVGNARIQVFNGSGLFLRAWGSAGGGDGHFSPDLADLAVDAAGDVYVTDRRNGLQVYDATGHFMRRLTLCGGMTQQSGTGVASSADGSLYVFDMAAFRLCKYDATGNVIASWTGPGSGAGGMFTYVGGIALAPSGEIYAAELFDDYVREYVEPSLAQIPAPTG
jgi:sugar lactone lactonase YvrE